MLSPTEHARVHRAEIQARFRDFLRLASVSTLPEHRADVRQAAEWVAGRLREARMDVVRVDDTDGHPIVFGSRTVSVDAPTVLVYGHYDVQPAEPIDLWVSPPFNPTERDGAIYARGASDDKGQVVAHLEAAAAFEATIGRTPVNLKYVIEGEEEIGSPNLAGWLEVNADALSADLAVVSDTAMLGRSQPSIVYGLRGLAYVEIEVAGPRHDLHSGQFGGAVLNPAGALCRILAGLHDDGGRVAVPGFYDRVRSLSDAERADLAQLPFDMDAFDAAAGDAGRWGEAGFTVIERLGARPTLDINGLWSGWTGAGAKTVLPAKAFAKVSMRLVPDQDPDEIAGLLESHVKGCAPAGAKVEVRALHGAKPAIVDREAPWMVAAARAYETAYGRAPAFSLEGGSIPVVSQLKDLLGLDTVLLGFGLPDDNLHAPNEKFDVDQLHKGIETIIAFLEILGAEGVTGRA
jgi:acetylornithine deacetylase/succinyl-diaminopimelate desuccinylase-like protein